MPCPPLEENRPLAIDNRRMSWSRWSSILLARGAPDSYHICAVGSESSPSIRESTWNEYTGGLTTYELITARDTHGSKAKSTESIQHNLGHDICWSNKKPDRSAMKQCRWVVLAIIAEGYPLATIHRHIATIIRGLSFNISLELSTAKVHFSHRAISPPSLVLANGHQRQRSVIYWWNRRAYMGILRSE